MSDFGDDLPPPESSAEPESPPAFTSPIITPSKPVWRRWWVNALLVVLVGYVVIQLIKGNDEPGGAETPSSTNVPATSVVESTEPTGSSELPSDLPGFGEGTFLVGSDVDPGMYLVYVPTDSFGCYWARLGGLSGENQDTLANDNTEANAHVIVEILPSDEAFESQRCGRWLPYEPLAQPVTAFGNGTWVVGGDIVAGRYRSTGPGPDDFCYWRRESAVTGNPGDVIAADTHVGSAIVDIVSTDFSFLTSGCGDWALIE